MTGLFIFSCANFLLMVGLWVTVRSQREQLANQQRAINAFLEVNRNQEEINRLTWKRMDRIEGTR